MSPVRGVAALVVTVALAGGSGTALGRGSTDRVMRPPKANRASVVRYRSPVSPLTVVRPFRPPATRFGPGHLGVDLAAGQGSVVRAAAAGVVTFAGMVAGRPLVVVRHADGIRTEYEPLWPMVHVGRQVGAGAALGRLHGAHRGCRSSCLHWGARRGPRYLDPLSLLQPLGPVRLLPWTAG